LVSAGAWEPIRLSPQVRAKKAHELFNYRLGSRSALDWVIDQYQISTESPRRPAASSATPTIPTKSEYIVRLVGTSAAMSSSLR
jgi:predicted helicase